jgi:hypothetical protein
MAGKREEKKESNRAVQRESISSMKIIDGFDSRAISNICLTSLSLSPCHLETKSEDDMAKNVLSASVATALARYDFPVPG